MSPVTNEMNHGKYRPGDFVEVQSLAKFLATLDSNGTLEGLPYMPEMIKYCGCRFRVYRRINKVFLDGHGYVARLKNTVFLEGVRCDGCSHDGCQIGCLLFWKEAWLSPADSIEQTTKTNGIKQNGDIALPTTKGENFSCQATELARATSRIAWWDIRQYIWDYFDRDMSIGQWTRMLTLLVYNKLRRACGLEECGGVHGQLEKTTSLSIGFQPGDAVQVKSMTEIEATLDKLGRNRGLGFAPEMVKYCEKTYRIARRVEKLLVEWSGELREINNTVTLEGVTCDGMARRSCPRDCYHLWREAWLKKV